MKTLCFLCLLCLGLLPVQAEVRLRGQVFLTPDWERTLYVSVVPNLAEMYSVSAARIVLWGPIDSTGHFDLVADYLPAEPQLYRVHVVKKGDPAATITIGGQAENFLFLMMQEGSETEIQDQSTDNIWAEVSVQGGTENQLFAQLHAWQHAYEAQRDQGFAMGTKFLTAAYHEKLRQFADTTQSLLLALYALNQTPIETHLAAHPAYYQQWLVRWEGNSSPYLAQFRDQVQLPAESSSLPWVWLLLCLIAGGAIGWLARGFWQSPKHTSEAENEESQRFTQLSLQERNIFLQLREGKSTKEIAQELHIEPSTVKSHTQRIYRKLEINSRREAVDFPLPVEGE